MAVPGVGGAAAGSLPKRLAFKHDGRTIYEWEQGYEEVNVFIAPPPGVTAKLVDCKISVGHVRLGVKGNPPYLDADLSGPVVVDQSFWTMEDGTLHLTLTKARPGETWGALFVGHGALHAADEDAVKRSMLLERFQAENPGMDFSGAEVTGSVPDPRTFMRDLPPPR